VPDGCQTKLTEPRLQSSPAVPNKIARRAKLHVYCPDSSILRLRQAAEALGLNLVTHDGEEAFMAGLKSGEPVIAVAGLFLGEQSGLDLLEMVERAVPGIPFIIHSSNLDAGIVRQAFKAGAYDVLSPDSPLMDMYTVLAGAIRLIEARWTVEMDSAAIRKSFESLTKREVQVLRELLKGKMSKEVSRDLNIAHRTVDVHRAAISRKFGIKPFSKLQSTLLSLGYLD
jgi:FixJ family two-component response regulator